VINTVTVTNRSRGPSASGPLVRDAEPKVVFGFRGAPIARHGKATTTYALRKRVRLGRCACWCRRADEFLRAVCEVERETAPRLGEHTAGTRRSFDFVLHDVLTDLYRA